MKMRTSATAFAALLATTSALVPASAHAQQIRVRVNGNNVPFANTQPQSVDGRVLVPLRGVLEQIGADINWNEATQTVKAHMGDRDIELQLGRRTAQVNGEAVSLNVPAMRIGGSTMVPLRFIGEALGATVDWNEDRQVVDISTSAGGSRPTPVDSEPARVRERPRNDRTDLNRGDRRIQLRVDGHEESFGAARPYMRGEDVMVPLERVAYLTKFNYRYDTDDNTIYVREKMVKSKLNSRVVEKDGRRILMNGMSEMHNGILYVPLQFIEIVSDSTAQWNPTTRTVVIR